MFFPEAIKRICQLPRDIRSTGDRSAIQFLRETGFFDAPGLVDRELLVEFLGAHTDLVSDWLQWSEDKRCSDGWYFTAELGGYAVGFHPGDEYHFFFDRVEACAYFVLKELESLRRHGSQAGSAG